MKGKRNVWAVFLGIAVVAMSAAGCSTGESSGQGPEKVSAEKRLTVYTSHKQEVYAPIIKEFEERTGIWVEVVSGGTTELLERIQEEGEKGSCDVMFGGGVESYEVFKDCFMSYESTQIDHIESIYRTEDHVWTISWWTRLQRRGDLRTCLTGTGTERCPLRIREDPAAAARCWRR